MSKFYLKDVETFILDDYKSIESLPNAYFENVKPIDQADEFSLVWCSPNAHNKTELIENTNANFIICDNEFKIPDHLIKLKNFIIVENPRLTYSRIIRALFVEKKEIKIHPSVIIHKDALIDKNVSIGPNCYIGKCKIEEGTIIDGNAYFYDNVEIGKNVIIEAGVVLGAQGFGQTQNKKGEWEPFPHIGGIIIQDNVTIGANTTIDKGTLGNTIIGQGSKISKSVRIAHNVQIGKNSIVTGGVVVSGSVKIGDNVWVGPNATLLNKITIENNVFIGIGATVAKSVKEGCQVIGTRIIPKN